jgi:hypothetical protein
MSQLTEYGKNHDQEFGKCENRSNSRFRESHSCQSNAIILCLIRVNPWLDTIFPLDIQLYPAPCERLRLFLGAPLSSSRLIKRSRLVAFRKPQAASLEAVIEPLR